MLDSKALQDLENIFDKEIVLANKMGLKIESFRDNTLSLQAPLELNINDKKTAFGGSIYSIAVLSGWGLIYLKLKELGIKAEIVIYKSEIKYKKAIKSNLEAKCSVENVKFEDFIQTFKSKSKSKIQLTSKLYSDNEEAVIFEGIYAIYQ